jgi:hypothetical protein
MSTMKTAAVSLGASELVTGDLRRAALASAAGLEVTRYRPRV